MNIKKNMTLFIAFAVLGLFIGCTSTPSFPVNGSPVVESKKDFGVLSAQPDVYQGRAIKLAGRIVGVESTEDGTILLAEWLPYPSDQNQGPTESATLSGNRFRLFYPGKIDREGALHGNKFLVIGKIVEQQPGLVTRRFSSDVPHINARCLHVWKTGSAELEDMPDVENTGYPIMEQTYCSEI